MILSRTMSRRQKTIRDRTTPTLQCLQKLQGTELLLFVTLEQQVGCQFGIRGQFRAAINVTGTANR